MRLDVRSGVFAVIATVVAVVSTLRIGSYTLSGMVLLLVVLAAGLVAVSMRADRVVMLPTQLGRWGLAVGVLLASVLPRFATWPGPDPQSVVHGVVSGLVVLLLVRTRHPIFADHHPLLALAGLILPCQAACWDGIAYPNPDSLCYQSLPWLSLALFATMGFAVTRTLGGLEQRLGWVLLLVLLILGGAVRLCGVIASPDPVIDVWSWRREAPQYLLRGENPYGASYPDAYTTERARFYGLFNPESPGFSRELPTYPPLPIYLSLPFAAAGLDVRYAEVVCDLLAASMIGLAGWTLRNRAVAVVAAGVYLGYPFAARVVEQSWFEPMLAGMLGAGLVLLKRGYRIGGLFVGLGLVGKQFGVAIAPAALAACRRSWWAFAVGLAVAAALTLGVFLIWDARTFLNIILFFHTRMGPRLDSLTITSLCYQEFDLRVGPELLWPLMLVLCGYIALRTPACPIAGAVGMGLSLFVFCLFNSQANFNYYYLCVYLLLLGIVGFTSSHAAKPEPPG